MLTDSPWAKPVTVAFSLEARSQMVSAFIPGVRSRKPAGPPQGNGARTEIYLTARWASALPIRQAFAIQDFGRANLDSAEARQLLTVEPEEHILELAGFPTILFNKGPQTLEAALRESAALDIPGRPPLSPASVAVPEHGTHLMATLRFPRIAGLQPGDGSLVFTGAANTMRLEQAFRLKLMVYQSKLEI